MGGFGSVGRGLARGLRDERRMALAGIAGQSISISLLVLCSCSAGAITAETGSCVADTGLACSLDLVGYSCLGSARPDQNPSLSKGVQGLVCDDQGPLPGVGEGYCCTAKTTTCAFDSSAVCPTLTAGYSCAWSDIAPPNGYPNAVTSMVS